MNSADITYKTNSASLEQIYTHLIACDESFIPPLSKKTDINNYSKKIKNFATTFEAWYDNKLIGLIAVYCNNISEKNAYITNVSVELNFKGMGVASTLMDNTVKNIKSLNFNEILLEVNKNNFSAINLYKKYNFEILELNEYNYKMKLTILP